MKQKGVFQVSLDLIHAWLQPGGRLRLLGPKPFQRFAD